MHYEKIRAHAFRRPFVPFVLHLENGEQHVVRTPEIIVTDEWVVSVTPKGELFEIDVDVVSAISHVRRKSRPKP